MRASHSALKANETTYHKTVLNVIVLLMVTYVVTTLFQGVFGSIPINRIIGFVLFFALALEWIAAKKTHVAYLTAIIFSLLALRSLLFAGFASQEITDWVYLSSTLLIIELVLTDRTRDMLYEALQLHRSFIESVVVGSALLLLFLLLTRTGYVEAWGEEPYFKGLCNTEHTLASICSLLFVLILFLVREGASKGLNGFCFLVVLYALFETGARTYLVPASICLLILLGYLTKHLWTKIVIMGSILVLGALIFSSSNMGSKFEFAQNNTYADSLLSAVTNGRNEIWATDVSAWANSELGDMFFGNSFSSIYILNQRTLTLSIWAHNDLVMVLYGIGLAGFLLYLAVLIGLSKALRRVLSKENVLLVGSFILFPLLLNGFFPYQHLVYASALLFAICSHRNIHGGDFNVTRE